jgi:AAA family ATP:ADP antiporter
MNFAPRFVHYTDKQEGRVQRSQRPSPVDRLLRLFTDVRVGESGTVLLLTLNIFLILMAYYFIKPVREALILDSGGAEVKSYSAAGQALLLLGLVPLYGTMAGRLPRRKLINVVTAFFAVCLVAFFMAGQAAGSTLVLAIIFFLWVGIFNVMVVAQFWSFANDIYTRDEGERLFPIVAFGASSGAVLGSWVSGNIITVFGVFLPLVLAAGILVLSLLITSLVDARERRRTEIGVPDVLTTAAMPAASGAIRLEDIRKALEEYDARAARGSEEVEEEPEEKAVEPRVRDGLAADITQTLGIAGKGEGPFRMVLRCRYLLFIALLILLLNWVNTTGEYILGSVVQDTAVEAVAAGTSGGLTVGEYIGAFYSNFFAIVNVFGLFIQLFLVSRIIKYVGVQVSLVVLPLIALGGYALLALYPLLSFVRWAKTAENATDYSLQNTVRNVIFLPCTREQKYKAKQAIDSFFWRAGDVFSAVVVFIGTTYLAMQASGFAIFNIGLVVVWLLLAVVVGREYKRLVASGRPPCA